MKLPANLRVSFQRAYLESHGIEIDAEQADALGWYLLDLVGTALTIRAEAIHRSRLAAIDKKTNKRDDELDVQPTPV